MQKRGFIGANGKKLSTPPEVAITISPGSTSRTNSAPMMSRAQVSEASTQPSPTFPSISGRTPSGSRTPMSLERVMATIEKAPSTRRSASLSRSGMVFWIERAIRWMMHSVSEPDWKIEPCWISSSRKRERVRQVAVVGDGAAAHGELGEQRLHVADLGVALGAGGRVADVADGERAGQGLHQRGGGEAVADVAEAAGRGEALGGAVGDDAGGLLAAMLQRMQAEGDEARRVLHADHAEDAALLAQLVVVERMGGQGHRPLGKLPPI